MKKTLRKESEIFFSYSGGQITPWDASDENVLVIAANHGLKHVFEETTLYIDERMIFESAAAAWLTQLVENGVTEQLIDELNAQTSDLRYRRVLDVYDGGVPRWTSIADLGDDEIQPESKAAYAISHLIGSGAFERLRQCHDDGCDRFFLGPPNSKWCSKRCGSRARGRLKRKRDRDAGVLPNA